MQANTGVVGLQVQKVCGRQELVSAWIRDQLLPLEPLTHH
jgi:hypothetical protein